MTHFDKSNKKFYCNKSKFAKIEDSLHMRCYFACVIKSYVYIYFFAVKFTVALI